MKTLTELTREEAQVRERAGRYEKALNELANSRTSLASLEARLATPQPGLQALRTIHALLGEIPLDQGIVTAGDTRLVMGGIEVRTVLMATVPGALNRVAAKRKVHEDKLQVLKDRVAKAEAAMAEFTD